MEKILIVDDEEGMRLAMSEALKRAGYITETSVDGISALAKLESEKYSMVITDMKMPKVTGMDLLREIKKISPDTKVILVTAYGTVDCAVEAMKEGASDFLLKPFSFESLLQIVKGGFASSGKPSAHLRSPTMQTNKNIGDEVKEIVTKDKIFLRILNMAVEIAKSDSTVLVYGESGTGKELIAQLIHENSNRKSKPFVAINCAAIPDNLLESELFGHEKGSFTGAAFRKYGKFELAQGGTLLLDEIGEMSMTLQAKLLRVLQEFEVDRVGGKEPVPIDVRVISTTNVDIKQAISEKKFREDLYYRLNVIPIRVPPLRDRKGDVEVLTEHFIKKMSSKNNKNIKGITKEALDILINRKWYGNVRELQNMIERAVLLCRKDNIRKEDFILEEIVEKSMSDNSEVNLSPITIDEMEKKLIEKTLNDKGGNRTHAAKSLGISIRTLRNKLNEYKDREVSFNAV
jgi:DNA-binding NtrC family response regulator